MLQLILLSDGGAFGCIISFYTVLPFCTRWIRQTAWLPLSFLSWAYVRQGGLFWGEWYTGVSIFSIFVRN